MGVISTTQARGIFTSTLIDVFKEKTMPTSFLRSFFGIKESATKYVNIEVMRGTEKVAVDVMRGTEGNRNSFGKSTETVILPPYYREYFDATELELYDRLFGQTNEIDSTVFAQLMDSVAEKLSMLQAKIERAYEKQCSDVLTSGVLTLSDGTSIDFKRKAASILDLSTINSNRYWTDNTNSKAIEDLETGCKFLREKGKSQGATVNAIFGSKALSALLDNTKVKSRADIRNFNLDNISAPQRNSVGASLHGQLSAGAYNLNIWSYPEVYETNGSTVPYIADEKVILVPETPKFTLGFAAVPRLLSNAGAVTRGAYVIGDFVDERNSAHIFDVKSAGVAVPVAVDQIYTLKVVA